MKNNRSFNYNLAIESHTLAMVKMICYARSYCDCCISE